MKVVRKYSDSLSVEVEGTNIKEIWKQLAAADDAFGHMKVVAKVDGNWETSDEVHFVHRQDNEGNDYYELQAAAGKLRGFRKSFGQHKKGNTLFAKEAPQDEEAIKRQADKGYKLTQGGMGWYKYSQ